MAPALIAGVDEAGRGPLAGPVVAAAVVLGARPIAGLADSKKLSASRRAALEAAIKAECRWALGMVEADEIDRLNIFAATMLAMTRAVAALGIEPDEVLIDGNHTPARWVSDWRWPARAIVGGDALEPAISAASILAKQARDALMHAADARWPAYGFARHKGYGTRDHLAALAAHGPSPIHRMSFAPCAQARLDLRIAAG